MSDLISRDDVDKAIRSICDLCGEDKKNNGVMCGACNLDSFIREYEDLPSAEPDRTAKVESITLSTNPKNEVYKCSKCGQYFHRTLWSVPVRYCPSCGARLEWE